VQVVFVMQNTPVPDLILGDMKISTIQREQAVAKYDLLLALTPDNETISGTIEYDTALFSKSTIEDLAEMYKLILYNISSDNNKAVLDFVKQDTTSQNVPYSDTDDQFFNFSDCLASRENNT
jgi:hypothetical protein